MFIKSIRWRLQLWLAFLLAGILSGFGLTAYQLHRTNRLNQIDADLAQRVSALLGDLRAPPFLNRGPGHGPGRGPGPGSNPGRPPSKPDHDFPRLPRFDADFKPPPEWREDWLDNREVRLSPGTANLFASTETNDFYYTLWSRTGRALQRATNAPRPPRAPQPANGRTRPSVPHAGRIPGSLPIH